ncbi:hypothetical protein P7K49_029534 [Saguinus oedipus]|uniref:Uncharacterized protein n=1 Tax=Saguinus oedipus TaxID=9490 RepID=A0ABQ9U7G4_SAGOE|nr:hypothetical protein P7K49_029534 [Saguinus oedipus]
MLPSPLAKLAADKRTLRAQLLRVQASENTPLLPGAVTWALCALYPCPGAKDPPVELSCLEPAACIPQFTLLVGSLRCSRGSSKSSYEYPDTWNQPGVKTTPRISVSYKPCVPSSNPAFNLRHRYRSKPVLCAHYSRMSCSSGSAVSLRTLREALEQIIAFLWPRTPSSTPYSHPEIMSRAIMESGGGMPEQDKDPRVQEKPDDQKGGPEGTRDARSAFRPLRDSGGLSPFKPRPRPLQRDLHTRRSEIPSDKKSQPSGMSCCPKCNAISSSSSSTGGFPWLKRPASSHCRLPLTSSKTVSEVSPQAVSQGQAQCEKAADSAPGEKPATRSGSPTSQASRPGRRKFPLLPRRQGESLMLPPPLQLGFRVTAEDLDLEKKAEFLCINSALRGEDKSILDCRASLLSHALSSQATGTSSLPAVPKASSTDAQQERCKSQDGLDPVALQASAAGSPSRPPVSGRKRKSAGPLFSSSDTLPATSAHSRDLAQASSSTPIQPAQGTTAHSAAGASLPTTFTSSPRTKRKSTWAAGPAGTLPDPSSASHTTTLARQRKLAVIAAAATQPKPVVLHGQQQGTRTLKRPHPSSHPAASAAAQASSSAPTRPAQGTAAHSAAAVSLPTTSTWSLAGTLSNPSSASHATTLARQRVSGPT